MRALAPAAVAVLALVLGGCASPPAEDTSSCSITAADGSSFVLVRGPSAVDDCSLLLSGLLSSTGHMWGIGSLDTPPSGSSTRFCDQSIGSGARLTVWGDATVNYGATICSGIQAGVSPANLSTATPTPACSLTYSYESGTRQTIVIVRGPGAIDECNHLSQTLPQGPWQLALDGYSSYRICSRTVGAWQIEVYDSAVVPPPDWTQQMCAGLSIGSL